MTVRLPHSAFTAAAYMLAHITRRGLAMVLMLPVNVANLLHYNHPPAKRVAILATQGADETSGS